MKASSSTERTASIIAKTFNPWYFRSSEVDIFRESTGAYSRVLGADAHFFGFS